MVAPGSTLIQGIANQTMIVEQQDGIVVVEGALSSPRAEALIDYIEATYPGKPIRYVTGSHHHADHSGGMRPFVALGARPVVHEAAVPFFEQVFAARGSRLLPDRLDDSDAAANILAVPATGAVTLDDPRPARDGAGRADGPRDDDDPRLRAERGRAVRQRRHVHAREPARPRAPGRSTRRSGPTG